MFVQRAVAASLRKTDLHELADRLLLDDPGAVQASVSFLLEETRGYWHNRARAMISRRLKHCSTTREQRSAVVECILERLETGNFSEQFRDQLRLALHFNRAEVVAASRKIAANTKKDHVRRLANWLILNHG